MKRTNYFNQKGAIFALALIALTAILVITVVIVTNSYTYKQSSRYSLDNLEATTLAEAGIDKAVASLNKSGGSYSGEQEEFLGAGSYSVTVTDIDQNTKKVESTGYIPSKSDPKLKSTATVMMQKGAGIAFSYGIQAGDGGFDISGGSRVNGSVYSNNDINISGGGVITGDAYVAAGTSPTADIQKQCEMPNCDDYIFGKSVNGENRLDVAQSFRPSTTSSINKVSLRLKKVGTPTNINVRIMTDNGGKPSKTSLALGTLAANLVTTQYSYVDIGFTTNPTLNSNTTYWIMLDTASDNANYWVWSRDTLGTYTQGSPSFSPNWGAGNPSWTAISGDLDFKTYMGGDLNRISGVESGYINGSAYANTLIGDNPSALIIGQHAYYQTQNSIMAHGQNCNSQSNTYCHPGSTDPPPLNFPISQANIDEWKDMADDVVQNGDYVIQWPCNTTLQKKKYVGNVTVQGGCNIQIESPVWITGNLNVTGGSTVRLNSSYGPASGVVVSDGAITLNGGSKFLGSGQAGSYLTAISTYNSQINSAVTVSGGNSSSIVFAPYGIIDLQGGTNLREATAWKIRLTGGAIVTYETGVANPFFSSGPQGSFSVVSGTYQLK